MKFLIAFLMFSLSSAAFALDNYEFNLSATYVMKDTDSKIIAKKKAMDKMRYLAAEKTGSFVESVSEFKTNKGMLSRYKSVTSALVSFKNVREFYKINSKGNVVLRLNATAIVEKVALDKKLALAMSASNGARVKNLEIRNDYLMSLINKKLKEGSLKNSPEVEMAMLEFVNNSSQMYEVVSKDRMVQKVEASKGFSASVQGVVKRKLLQKLIKTEVDVNIKDIKKLREDVSNVTVSVNWHLFGYIPNISNMVNVSFDKGIGYRVYKNKNREGRASHYYYAMSNTFVAIELDFGGEKRYLPVIYPGSYDGFGGCSIVDESLKNKGLDSYFEIYRSTSEHKGFCIAQKGGNLWQNPRNKSNISFELPDANLVDSVRAKWVVFYPNP